MIPPSPPIARCLLVSVLAASASAQAPEDPGPHPVGQRDVSFSHPLASNSVVTARVYYPGLAAGVGAAPDPSSGPYPLVGFLHGYFAANTFYDELCTHLASWGFVVASVGTESGLFQNIAAEGHDAHGMLHWADGESANPSSFLFGMLSADPWTCVGHSNGGAAIFHFSDIEPRLETIALLEPNWPATPALDDFDGSVAVVGASADFVAPAAINAAVYYAELSSTARRWYALIEGAGHNGSLDFPSSIEPMPFGEQQRLHRLLVGAFLRAQVFGEEALYVHLLGEGILDEPVTRESACEDPPLWTATSAASPGNLVCGIAGAPGDTGFLAVSVAPASIPTPFGTLGLNLGSGFLFHTAALGADGITEATLPLVPGLTGLPVLFQGLAVEAGAGALSAVSTYVLP